MILYHLVVVQWFVHLFRYLISLYCDIFGKILQVSDYHLDEISGARSSLYAFPKEHFSSQKAMSLPTSPHEYRSQASGRSGTNDEMVTTWNKILESPMFQNRPLLPFHEWNIDFSEITVGTRVGIGEHYFLRVLLFSSSAISCIAKTTAPTIVLISNPMFWCWFTTSYRGVRARSYTTTRTLYFYGPVCTVDDCVSKSCFSLF